MTLGNFGDKTVFTDDSVLGRQGCEKVNDGDST